MFTRGGIVLICRNRPVACWRDWLRKRPEILWGKWMAKWCMQPFIVYILLMIHIFPCSKWKIKRENSGKKSKVTPSCERKEKRKSKHQSLAGTNETQTWGLILSPFTLVQINKNRLKSRGEQLSGNFVTKQNLPRSFLYTNAFSVCVHQNENLFLDSYWASGRNVPPKGENMITGFTAQRPEQPASDGEELGHGTWH